jgi:hypothetical protein
MGPVRRLNIRMPSSVPAKAKKKNLAPGWPGAPRLGGVEGPRLMRLSFATSVALPHSAFSEAKKVMLKRFTRVFLTRWCRQKVLRTMHSFDVLPGEPFLFPLIFKRCRFAG